MDRSGEPEPSAAPLLSLYPAPPPPVAVRLVTVAEHACSYLPQRQARSRAFLAEQIPPDVYERFMAAGFRRSGKIVYQPVCRGCRACVPIRVPVDRFIPSKSQRRCWRRNQDLRVAISAPVPTDEKFSLYRRYILDWHDGEMGEDRESFESFLYESPVESIEFSYRDSADRLLAVGLCDVGPASLSSVYFYHDPDASRRGLGTFGALHEIDFARKSDFAHYYLGYWIEQCRTMRYKSVFRPNEILCSDGVWRDNAHAAP